MKKRSETTQTLRAGCSKADPETNKQTNTETGAITVHCAAASLARSVIIEKKENQKKLIWFVCVRACCGLFCCQLSG